MRVFVLLLIILFLFNCSAEKTTKGFYLDGIYKNKEVKYSMGELPDEWVRLDVESLNMAFYNKKNNGIIYTNGKCNKSSDNSLKVLQTHLLIGFKNKKFETEELIKYQKRDCLRSVLTAELDGIERKINYYVFKKDGCLFDIVLISPPEFFEENNKIFSELIINKFKILKGSNIKVFVK